MIASMLIEEAKEPAAVLAAWFNVTVAEDERGVIKALIEMASK